MLDLSLMKGVHVDPARGSVRAQGGVTWGEYNRAAATFGLATTGGVVSTTGIAGLTLGGGLGWLMGRYGMAVDNLLSAEVVLASGEVTTASEDGDRDLFWAIQGGGGNFGVATWLEYRAHPLATVLAGPVLHRLTDARDVFRFYRDLTAHVPDEVTTEFALLHAPDGSGPSCAPSPSATAGGTPIGRKPTSVRCGSSEPRLRTSSSGCPTPSSTRSSTPSLPTAPSTTGSRPSSQTSPTPPPRRWWRPSRTPRRPCAP
jgi:FAD/FMN-containing dehydrogenase